MDQFSEARWIQWLDFEAHAMFEIEIIQNRPPYGIAFGRFEIIDEPLNGRS